VDRLTDPQPSSLPAAALAGARCKLGQKTGQETGQESCRCRVPGDDAESDAPPEGKKRFEVRLSADGGSAALSLSDLGRIEVSGPREACFYLDLPSGSTRDMAFLARADSAALGVAPRLEMSEYGPAGPYWYALFSVECRDDQGGCTRQAADAWASRLVSQRKRGRLDPCGSAVISKLAWDTSGGQAERDGGLYRDLNVRFSLEVKKWKTQFAPGSTECVPK
jgi:hypothetical protein